MQEPREFRLEQLPRMTDLYKNVSEDSLQHDSPRFRVPLGQGNEIMPIDEILEMDWGVDIDISDSALAARYKDEVIDEAKQITEASAQADNIIVNSAGEEVNNPFSRPTPPPGMSNNAVSERIFRANYPPEPRSPGSPPTIKRPSNWHTAPRKSDEPQDSIFSVVVDSPEQPEVQGFTQTIEPEVAENGSTTTPQKAHRRSHRHRPSIDHRESIQSIDVEPKIGFFKGVLQKLKRNRQPDLDYEPEYRAERRKRVLATIGLTVVATVATVAVINTVGAKQEESPDSTTAPTYQTYRHTTSTSIPIVRANQPSLTKIDQYTTFYNLNHMATAEDITSHDKAFADMLAWYEANPGGDLVQALQNFQS